MKLLSNKGLAVAAGALAFAVASVVGTSTTAADYMRPGEGVTVQPMGPGFLRRQMEEDIIITALEELGYDVKPAQHLKYALMFLSIASGDGTYTPGYAESAPSIIL